MTYVALFFAGAFLCNCIPHLAAGLMGMPFPSPFAKPSGKGDSLPLVNFLWGAFNLIAGLVLLVRNPFGLGLNAETLVLATGFLALGIFTSLHFGAVHREKHTK